MSAISGWMTGIFAVAVVCLAVDLLFSGSRMEKAVRMSAAAVMLAAIVLPLPAVFGSAGSCSGAAAPTYDPPLDEHYLAAVSGRKLSLLETAAEREIASAGLGEAEVDIEGRASGSDTEILKVTINFVDSVIDGDDGHIHRNESAAELLSGFLNIDRDRITVNG